MNLKDLLSHNKESGVENVLKVRTFTLLGFPVEEDQFKIDRVAERGKKVGAVASVLGIGATGFLSGANILLTDPIYHDVRWIPELTTGISGTLTATIIGLTVAFARIEKKNINLAKKLQPTIEGRPTASELDQAAAVITLRTPIANVAVEAPLQNNGNNDLPDQGFARPVEMERDVLRGRTFLDELETATRRQDRQPKVINPNQQ